MPDRIKALAAQRDKLISSLLDRLEASVKVAQTELLRTVISDFADTLELDEDGNVKNTIGNKRRLAVFDSVFKRFAQSSGLEVVKVLTEGVGRLVDFNEEYFTTFAPKATLAPIQAQVKETLSAWLGLTDRGKVETNGYLDTLVKSETVKNQIKNITLKTVVGQGGFFDLRKSLESFIQGNKEQTGALEKYYNNYAYDTLSVADRTASKLTADKLKLEFAFYEGGLVKDSRKFCREHNGKLYTSEEIAAFEITEARPPNYNPFVDLGGFRCRHHLNFVPAAIAYAVRPELKPK